MNNQEEKFELGLEQFSELCSKIEDPRATTQTRYPIVEVLFLSVCSIASGYEANREIEEFGRSKLDWLRKFHAFKNGTPTHETIGKVIGFIDKRAFELSFVEWVTDCFGADSELLIHLDGKRLSNSAPRMLQDKKDEEGGQRPEAIVNAYASDSGIVLAHNSITQHGDERRGAKEIIDWLSLKDAIITGDSNFCDKDILDRIIKKGGDYIMVLKGNNPILLELSKQYFGDVRMDKMPHYTQEKGHGRYEYRYYHSIKAEGLPDKKFSEYAGLCQIIRVNRKRTVLRKDKYSEETHYYITSLDKPIKYLAQAIRNHWRIENNLHWVLDVEFKEDLSTKRTANQAANFSLLKKVVLNMINQKRGKKSIKATRMKCALSDKERENILGLC